MTFEQLLYAEVLSHYRSMQQAADNLHITKSGLSLAITQLEEELGIKIFARTSKGSVMTEEGKQLIAHISSILRDRNTLENTAYQLRHKKRHHIHIHYMNTMLMPFVDAFIKNDHEVTLDISCHELEEIDAKVRSHEIDAGFIAINDTTQGMIDDLRFTPVVSTRLVILCSDAHPFTKYDRPITVDDLKDQKFCLFNDSSHDIIFDRLQMRCGPLRLVLRTDDSVMMNRAMRELNCVSFGRIMQGRLSTEPQLMDHIQLISLNPIIDDHFTLGWLTNPNYDMPAKTKDYLDEVTRRIQKEDE